MPRESRIQNAGRESSRCGPAVQGDLTAGVPRLAAACSLTFMPIDPRTRMQWRIQLGCGALLAGSLYAQLAMESPAPIINTGAPVVFAAEPVTVDSFERLVRDNPLGALIESRDRLTRQVRDYTCTFVKQERIADDISAEQETQVKFRAEPFSVMMEFTRNGGMAKRAIYVKGRWRDESNEDPTLRELAVCQPAKGLSLLIKSIKQPIHGALARAASRRAIDEFGFRRSLDLLIKYSEQAFVAGELGLEFKGETRFDGRKVWLIRRTLPYTGAEGPYPDRVANIYIDQEHKVPVAVYCYADDACEPQHLLGKYEYRNIQFNVGLAESDFDPATYGM